MSILLFVLFDFFFLSVWGVYGVSGLESWSGVCMHVGVSISCLVF